MSSRSEKKGSRGKCDCSAGTKAIERNWLRCLACNRRFKCQYSYDQHWRDKRQSQAPQPRAAELEEVLASSAVGPEESISQVMMRQHEEGQGAGHEGRSQHRDALAGLQ